MVFRIDSAMPASSFKTYQIRKPIQTHFRPATCEEVECPAYVNGWRTLIDEGSPAGQQQGQYIRRGSGRYFTEERDERGVTVFTFRPFQKCFAEHVVGTDRPPIYLVKGGDYRGNPRGIGPRVHTSAESWVSDFGEHQEKIADQLGRG